MASANPSVLVIMAQGLMFIMIQIGMQGRFDQEDCPMGRSVTHKHTNRMKRAAFPKCSGIGGLQDVHFADCQEYRHSRWYVG